MAADKQSRNEKINQLAAELIFSQMVSDKLGNQKMNDQEKEELLYELLAEISGFSESDIAVIQENIMRFPLSLSKKERKYNEISSLLLNSLGFGFYVFDGVVSEDKIKSNFRKMQSNLANKYNGVLFVETMKSTMPIYCEMVKTQSEPQDYVALFQSHYRTKTRGEVAEHFEEIYGETAKIKRDEVSNYLAKLGNVTKSSIRINILNRMKCYSLAKKLLNLQENDELPDKIKDDLDKLLATNLPSLDRQYVDDKGNVMDGCFGDIDNHVHTEELKNQNDDLVQNLLKMIDNIQDKQSREYIYYQILTIENATDDGSNTLDEKFVQRIPAGFADFFEKFGNGREDNKIFFGRYWGLQEDTVRKKISNIKKELFRNMDSSLKYNCSVKKNK